MNESPLHKIERLERLVQRSKERFAAQIDQVFPIGCRVVIDRGGNRFARGRVSHCAGGDGRVYVRLDNGGRVHRAHYSRIRFDG